ncbi:hypothetical protein D0T50_01385 [Bacteroides sp. 214]|uniref:TolB family protein n=1 Tax=Bacteroides sp. 214 TaxID=2302935 RepID=UPI0013D797AA|nr:hypothetical protein [Bacteroides sp. 214]NDW11538.1 hypothetical protein [Bacteroides sp. 214]
MLSAKRISAIALLLCATMQLYAQFVNYGTDPARYKWNIAKTEHYKIIYPHGNDSMAYRYGQLLETAYPEIQKSIGKSRRTPFPVVLHPGNMQSNGMVSWAPRRMELITTPSSDLYAQSWDRQLAIHESRHVLQTRKLMHGVFTPMFYLFGEQTAGIANFFVPTWFLEGDAVVTETALSFSGRGRLPEFNMIYRAQMAAEDFYSFDKWFLGSYKDYTGTKYALGYDMVAYGRHKYGSDLWNKVTRRYVKHFLNIPPFSSSFKHHTGSTTKKLFKETFEFLNEEWRKQDSIFYHSGFTYTYLTEDKKDYVEYKYPQAINNETVIALKTSLKDIASIVAITNGKEKNITHVGNINSRIIYVNGMIYWTEIETGLRWSHESYSVLKSHNLYAQKTKNITSRTRYQAPAISEDGTLAALSEYSEQGNNHIVILTLRDGIELARFATPENAFAKDIAFMGEDKLAVSAIGDNGITIWELNRKTSTWSKLLSPTWANVSAITWNDNKLWFESGADGTNNIYCLDPQTKETHKVTTARFGAFTPTLSTDNDQLLFADYQANGYKIAATPVDKLTKEKVSFTYPHVPKLAEAISEQETYKLDTVQLRDIDFHTKRYNKLLNLIKIHSWTPFYYDASDIINLSMDDFSTIVKPGAMFLSQNSLNTAITQLGWFYEDGEHHGKLAFSYTGLYPVFDINVEYGGKAFDFIWSKDQEGKDKAQVAWSGRARLDAEACVYIPFRLNKDQYIRGIQPAVTYYYTNNRFQEYGTTKFSDYQYILPEVRFYNYRRMAQRDILPKWGYQLRLMMLQSIANSNYGKSYAARLTTYLPGIFSNNSLMLRIGYQHQNPGKIFLSKKLIDFARGYSYQYATSRLIELKGDYGFSFLHPDFSLGSLAYIKRVRANLFYDLSLNKALRNSKWDSFNSYGADLLFDLCALQSDYPISAGMRMIKPIQKSGVSMEALFSISF